MNFEIEEINFSLSDQKNEQQSFSVVCYKDYLLVGTRNQVNGASLLCIDKTNSVKRVLSLGKNNIDIYGFAIFKDFLYFGTYNPYGGELFRLDSNFNQEIVFKKGLDDNNNMDIFSFFATDSNVFLGTWNPISGGKIYVSSDGDYFKKIYDTNDKNSSYVRCFTQYKDNLFASFGKLNIPLKFISISPNKLDCYQVFLPINSPKSDIYTMCVFKNKLFFSVAAYGKHEYGAEIWNFNGINYECSVLNGFGNPNNIYVLSLSEYDGFLFAATANYSEGCELHYTNDGILWCKSAGKGINCGYKNGSIPRSLIAYNNYLWFFTRNIVDGLRIYKGRFI